MVCQSSLLDNVQIFDSYGNSSNIKLSEKEFQPVEKEVNYQRIDALISHFYMPTIVNCIINEIANIDKETNPKKYYKFNKIYEDDSLLKPDLNIKIKQIEQKFQLKTFIIYKLLDLRSIIITKKLQFLCHPNHSSFDSNYHEYVIFLNKRLEEITKKLSELIDKKIIDEKIINESE